MNVFRPSRVIEDIEGPSTLRACARIVERALRTYELRHAVMVRHAEYGPDLIIDGVIPDEHARGWRHPAPNRRAPSLRLRISTHDIGRAAYRNDVTWLTLPMLNRLGYWIGQGAGQWGARAREHNASRREPVLLNPCKLCGQHEERVAPLPEPFGSVYLCPNVPAGVIGRCPAG